MIFIVGPTATGKTALALKLAEKLSADILSADSRQIYEGLEITSGADLPEHFTEAHDTIGKFKYFTNGKTNLYGVSFLKPDQEWSIAHFRDLAELISKHTQKNNKKLIVVGGSGLYHQALFLDKNILNIRPSEELRERLQDSTVEELQLILKSQYPNVETVLNESDWKNPRRLIRWIEKTTHHPSNSIEEISMFGFPEDHYWIGLNCQTEILETRIQQRVEERVKNGSMNEVELFLSHLENKKLPSISTLGVKDIALFINDQISKEELVKLWSKHEFQYSKRQMTWFNKKNYINWVEFDEVFPSQLIGDILE